MATNSSRVTLGIVFGLLTLAVPVVAGAKQQAVDAKKGERATPIGTWHGESKCQVRPSGCRDEDSVYRITSIEQSETRVNLAANKVVEGREVNMGTSECSYSSETRVLDCPLTNGSTMRFQLDGDSLIGSMTMANGTVWRKITLRRASAK